MFPRSGTRAAFLAGTLTVLTAAPASAQALDVGPGRAFATLGEALARAEDGDTVRVHPGTYAERVHVRTAVTLLGIDYPVLDGGGIGTVLTVEAPAEVRGLDIRGSGSDQAREDAGILVLAVDGARIAENRLTDVLFGIIVKQSRDTRVLGNRVAGKDLPIPRRGDGIRLWYCERGTVADNDLWRTRDLVIWFSSELEIRRNRIAHGRYGLHYMYSDHNTFVDNTFVSNDVGAFLMYSKDIRLRGNRFERAAGASALGIGLKDADDIVAEDNVMVGNAVGIFLDNSPSTVDGRNRFSGNLLAANGAGIEMLPSVHSNDFEGNAWVGNQAPVIVSGGGDALSNRWRGNYWSRYVGFDENADGRGDTPFRHDRLSDDLFARHPDLRFLTGSPAVASLEVLARLFPLLAPRPVVIDSMPLIDRPEFVQAELRPAAGDSGGTSTAPTGVWPVGFLMMTTSLSSAIAMALVVRRRYA